jgi:3-hydroxyisobutyrate dehydrogenase-like beta-hydroxyacid dehydrogenase
VKAVNQIIISSIMIANIEGLVFAAKSGANVHAVRDVLLTATSSNYLLQNWLGTAWLGAPEAKFKPGFALDLLRKDLAAALDAARAMKLPLPLSALAYQLYTSASAEGHGSDDYSAVAAGYERSADVDVNHAAP